MKQCLSQLFPDDSFHFHVVLVLIYSLFFLSCLSHSDFLWFRSKLTSSELWNHFPLAYLRELVNQNRDLPVKTFVCSFRDLQDNLPCCSWLGPPDLQEESLNSEGHVYVSRGRRLDVSMMQFDPSLMTPWHLLSGAVQRASQRLIGSDRQAPASAAAAIRPQCFYLQLAAAADLSKSKDAPFWLFRMFVTVAADLVQLDCI